MRRNVRGLAGRRRVYHGERTISVSDKDQIARHIHANVVGIFSEVDTARRFIGVRTENSDRSVARIGDVDHIARWHVGDALGFLEPGDDVHHLAFLEIDHANRVVAQFGDEQPLPFRIDGHVVDPAADVTERDFGLECERGLNRLGPNSGSPGEHQLRIPEDHGDTPNRFDEMQYVLMIDLTRSPKNSRHATCPVTR